jgi:anaphase-promoting complex subunit 3
MEIYSTILWHMRKEIELSYLAHDLVDFDKLAPESWCAVGNIFSLQKEHNSAIKFFQRVPLLPSLQPLINTQALQLDETFTYAYTLCGHEFVASDDLEKAQSYFR